MTTQGNGRMFFVEQKQNTIEKRIDFMLQQPKPQGFQIFIF